jgi:hypothetical protein
VLALAAKRKRPSEISRQINALRSRPIFGCRRGNGDAARWPPARHRPKSRTFSTSAKPAGSSIGPAVCRRRACRRLLPRSDAVGVEGAGRADEEPKWRIRAEMGTQHLVEGRRRSISADSLPKERNLDTAALETSMTSVADGATTLHETNLAQTRSRHAIRAERFRSARPRRRRSSSRSRTCPTLATYDDRELRQTHSIVEAYFTTCPRTSPLGLAAVCTLKYVWPAVRALA